jgi:hypothetical protein
MKRGLFIVFEGIDRCGKTTQVQRLLNHLNQKSVATELMKFPSIVAFIFFYDGYFFLLEFTSFLFSFIFILFYFIYYFIRSCR